MSSKFPYVDDKLVAALEKLFPDRLPDSAAGITVADVSRLVGQQEVIRYLKKRLKEQEM
jgi:hypothetical protein